MLDEMNILAVADVMQQVNQAWLEGRIEDLADLVHPDVVMVLPGFSGRIVGRDEFLAGFRDFSQNATVHEFQEFDQQIDVCGSTAVVSFRYVMLYDYADNRCQGSGRDLWVFQKVGEAWLAAWRTMLNVEEKAA